MNSLLYDRTRELLKSGEYSDFTIECEGEEFKVHRAILCPASDYFKNLCSNTSFEEGQSGRVSLKETRPEVLQCALKYIYTNEYIEPEHVASMETTEQKSKALLAHHIAVFLLADYCGFISLRCIAASNFKIELENFTGANEDAVAGLVPLFEHVYDRTSHDDTSIRPYLVQFAIKYGKHGSLGVFHGFFQIHEPVAWKVASILHNEAKENIHNLDLINQQSTEMHKVEMRAQRAIQDEMKHKLVTAEKLPINTHWRPGDKKDFCGMREAKCIMFEDVGLLNWKCTGCDETC